MPQRTFVRAVIVAAAVLAVIPVAVASATGGAATRHVQILDACDPATFNEAVGPGTCIRKGGGVKFDHFIAQLVQQGRAPAWRFSPPRLSLAADGTVRAKNRGGEEHTFSEVAAYGGGCVPVLNMILGLTPVPECSIPDYLDSTLVEPGDTRSVTELSSGVHRFQCLIHPWQHASVDVR